MVAMLNKLYYLIKYRKVILVMIAVKADQVAQPY